MTKVELQNITKAYTQGKNVLEPLSLTIKGGEFFFLLGPSGCGKSTLLRILAGLLEPDDGHILFNGTDVTASPPEQRRAAMVFQNYALWPHLNVFENVAFGLRAEHRSRQEIQTRVAEALALVRLADVAQRPVPSLSGGQQQRVALARALAVEPALLLLDEPLSNLDAQLRDEMRLEIHRITKERNLTAIYVTHDRREALSMADRIGVLHGGGLRQTGTPEELYNRPVDRFVAEFLGGANFLNAQVVAPNRVSTAIGEFDFVTPSPVGANLTLLLRPEQLRFVPENAGKCTVTLRERTFLGEHCEWRVALADGLEWVVDEYAPRPRSAGRTARLDFDSQALIELRG